MAVPEPVDVYEALPDIVGKVCGGARSLEFWAEGKPEAGRSVVYLLVEAQWLRFYFDRGSATWREAEEGKVPAVSADSSPPAGEAVLVEDLGALIELNGKRFTGIEVEDIDGGLMVNLKYEGGGVSFASLEMA